jgi:acyl-CoA thioesterase-2
MRADGLGDRPPWQHHALLAYTTDLTMIPTALRPFPDVGSGDAHRTFTTAVTSHTLWFHRPVDLTRWVRCEQQVSSVEGAFAFGTGAAWDSVGEPVVSYAQESLVRPKGATTP